MSDDYAQAVFDAGETLAQVLDHIAGCDHALYPLLDAALAGADPAVQRAVWAVVTAREQFRESAEAEVAKLTRGAMVH